MKYRIFVFFTCLLFIFCSGCFENEKKDETEYTFNIEFIIQDPETDYTLYTPFLVPKYNQSIMSFNDSFMRHIELNNSQIDIKIDHINNKTMLNISGNGSFLLSSGFIEEFDDYKWYILSSKSDYRNYLFYFQTQDNNSIQATINLNYSYGTPYYEYGQDGEVNGILENKGWQEVQGDEYHNQ